MGKVKTFKLEDTESLKDTDNYLIWVPVDNQSFVSNVAFETMEMAENVCSELGIDYEYIIPLHYVYKCHDKDIIHFLDDFVSLFSDDEDGGDNENEESE